MTTERPYTFDRTVRLVITVAVLVGLFLLTRQLSGVLLPFLISWFLAYLIHPIVSFFQYKLRLKNRTLSVIVTLVCFCAVITGCIALLAPLISSEFAKMGTIVTNYLSGINADTFLPERWQETLREWLKDINLSAWITSGGLTSAISKITPYLGGIVGGSINALMGLTVVFICILYLIFILIDYEKMAKGMVEMIPPKYRQLIGGILSDLSEGMNKYFRGQALIAGIVGILFAIGFSIMRLPLGIVIGLFIGVLNMVPYLQALGIPPCMILGLLQSADTGTGYWIILLEITAVFCIVQSIQDLILTPYIMGNRIGMKPALMLLALSIWGSLLGVAGMIIALPITTVMISYYKRFVLHTDDNKEDMVSAGETIVTESDNTVAPIDQQHETTH
ncbi:MAG: AI-2E family transporter [Bacteroidales bacterium]|nr:AI-2E family transporter [Bacteroidales bacterium]